MNPFLKGIYEHFTAVTTTGFYYDITGRMYLYHAPQQQVFPYCVYFPVTNVESVDFTQAIEELLVQFNVFTESNSSASAGTLLSSLTDRYDNCSLTVTNYGHLSFERTMIWPSNDYDRQPMIHGYAVEYRASFERWIG